MADFQEELSFWRKLQHLAVGQQWIFSASAAGGWEIRSSDPDILLLVDPNAMFSPRPVRNISLASPRLDDVTLRIEFDHRWRCSTAFARRRIRCRTQIVRSNIPHPMRDPDVIVLIDENS